MKFNISYDNGRKSKFLMNDSHKLILFQFHPEERHSTKVLHSSQTTDQKFLLPTYSNKNEGRQHKFSIYLLIYYIHLPSINTSDTVFHFRNTETKIMKSSTIIFSSTFTSLKSCFLKKLQKLSEVFSF